MSISPILTSIVFLLYSHYFVYRNLIRGCPRGVMVKAMDSGIVSTLSSYSSRVITFTFGKIPLGKVMNPLILPAMG